MPLNQPVRAHVSLDVQEWRCCDVVEGEQSWPDEDCLPNNIANDYLLARVHFAQNLSGNTFARINYDKDTYFVDVYVKEEQNTEWARHTHQVDNWEWRTRPRMINGKPASGRRVATVDCKNVLNGRYKCNQKSKYAICIHAYVKRTGVDGIVSIMFEENAIFPQGGGATNTNFTCDWRWCTDFYKTLDHIQGGGGAPPPNAAPDLNFCGNGSQRIELGPGCDQLRAPNPYGCGPYIHTGKILPKGDHTDPAFSGTIGPKFGGLGDNGTGPPDSVMNAIVMGGVPDMPYADVVKTGAMAGFGANYWQGTEYTLAPYGSGVLISGTFYPSGANGNPTGCTACTGTGSPSNVPPTGSGCGTVTYTYDTGVAAWIETSMTDACAGANCQAAMPPWPSAAHGTVKSTGCDPI